MVQLPKSVEEVYYFTFRKFPEGGQIKAWAYKVPCTKCGEGVLAKPKDEKTGKVKIRSKEFVCNKCGFEADKDETEATAKLEAIYTCPHCKKDGESSAPYKRKSYLGVQSYIVECQHCGEKIALTKKLKEPKPKKSKSPIELDD